jgi:hypothetical protein
MSANWTSAGRVAPIAQLRLDAIQDQARLETSLQVGLGEALRRALAQQAVAQPGLTGARGTFATRTRSSLPGGPPPFGAVSFEPDVGPDREPHGLGETAHA